MDQPFIPNTMPAQTLTVAPADLLQLSLAELLRRSPPRNDYSTPSEDEDMFGGLLMGPTSAAYLFLQMSARHPELRLQGHDALYWARKYMEGDRGKLLLEDGCCGLLAEKLAFEAVRASISREQGHVLALLENMSKLLAPAPAGEKDLFAAEMIYGRAGALYMLRMVRHWVPDCADLLEEPIGQLAQRILDMDDDGNGNWIWNDSRYFGAPHGDVGIITQIVLGVPSLAPKLAGKLEELLDLQTPEGNWQSTSIAQASADSGPGRVQFCHGAPGFTYALRSLKPHYPALHDRMDKAIEKGYGITWSNGLLRKEPNLCHGLFGNGL